VPVLSKTQLTDIWQEAHKAPEPAVAPAEPAPAIKPKPGQPGNVSVAGEDVNVIPKAASPEEKAHRVGLDKEEISDLVKTAKEEDHFFQNFSDPPKEEAGQLVTPDYGNLRNIYFKIRDKVYRYGGIQRADPELYDRLMKHFSERNAGVDKAVDKVKKLVGTPISSKDDVELSFIYEDKRLSPSPEQKEIYNKFSQALKAIEQAGLNQGLFPRTFQERMEEKILSEIQAHSEKVKSPEKSKVIQDLKVDLEKIRNMEYLPHRIVVQRVLESKLAQLKGEERKVFLDNLKRISFQYKTREGRSFLSEYVKSGLLEPKDVGIRKLTAETLADFYQKSALKGLFDYAQEKKLIMPASKSLQEKGWMTTREAGVTSPELKGKMIHPLLASAYSEIGYVRREIPVLSNIRRLFGKVKMAQFLKPNIIWTYDAIQMLWQGSFSMNPYRTVKYLKKNLRDVAEKSSDWHEKNKLNLFSFPSDFKRADLNRQIDMMIRQTSNEVPDILKKLESITKMTWKKSDLRSLHWAPMNTLANAAWTGDQVLRGMSYDYLQDKGATKEEAAKAAADTHGNYSILSDAYSDVAGYFLFVHAFRLLMPRQMIKMITDPITEVLKEKYASDNKISTIEAAKRIPKWKWQRWARTIAGTIMLPVMADLAMRKIGAKPEGKRLGPVAWKYRKEVTVDGQKHEVVIGMNYILNMPVKYWNRFTYSNPIDPKNSLLQKAEQGLKWEVAPLHRIFFWDIAQNRPSFGGGAYVYDPNATPAKQFSQMAGHVFKESYRFWGFTMNEFTEGRMTKKEKEAEQKIFDEAISRDQQKLISLFAYKYTRKDREEHKRIMRSVLRSEWKKRAYELRRKYEGKELQQRVQGLEEWRKRCEKWIEQGMR
jgi:hypothetical protein